MTPLLQVEDLRTWIATESGVVRAVDDVSLAVDKGEALGLVGESGSGKSMLARSIMGLLPPTAGTSGRVVLDGIDLLNAPEKVRREIWGPRVAMIFQDAGRALNPVVRIGRQMTEGMVRHLGMSKSRARERAVELLAEVGVPDPVRRLSNYPHQLSGGMRQRIMIAIALACEPDLLIADEPTTAVDVTVQRQILELLDRVRRDHGMGLILISHDLHLVAGRTDHVAVMYAGRVVERGPTAEVFATPQHRYTEALIASVPSLELPRSHRMRVIPGSLPDPRQPPEGCRFAPRCSQRTAECDAVGADYSIASNGILLPGRQHTCQHPVQLGDPTVRAQARTNDAVPGGGTN